MDSGNTQNHSELKRRYRGRLVRQAQPSVEKNRYDGDDDADAVSFMTLDESMKPSSRLDKFDFSTVHGLRKHKR